MKLISRSVIVLALTTVLALTASLAVLHGEVGKSLGVIDANTAAEKDLTALPHMNATLVKAVIDRRPFPSIVELNALLSQSLKPEQLTDLYGKVFIHLNLNTATDAEILLVPRAGARMVREFKEYRPYTSLVKFRREIGKYVDAAEVARLEQYVFVPVSLNAASDEDILSIPSMGARMLREFKEYRPYNNIEKFRREIGKYVDPKEVARLERYVTLN